MINRCCVNKYIMKVDLWDLPDNVYLKIDDKIRYNFFNFVGKRKRSLLRVAKQFKIFMNIKMVIMQYHFM